MTEVAKDEPFQILTLDATSLVAKLELACNLGWTQLHLLGPRAYSDDQYQLKRLSRFQRDKIDQTSVFRLSEPLDLKLLARAGQLRKLSLITCKLNGADWQSLGHLRHSLTSLDVRDCDIDEHGAIAFVLHLQQFSELDSLYIGENNIHKVGALALAKQLKHLPRLATLDLENNDIGEDGAAALADQFQHIERLTSLYLGRNGIGEKGAMALANHLKQIAGLELLNLEWNRISEAGTINLANELNHLTNLTTLVMNGNSIGDTGSIEIANQFRFLKKLSTFHVGDSGVGDIGSKAIIYRLCHLKELKSLDLELNNIGDAGTIALVDQLQHLTQLASLNLSRNQIGPVGAKHLKNLTQLTSLDLQYNHIGDDGIRVLAKAKISDKKLPHLKTITLTNNNIHCVEKSLLDTEDAERIFRAVLEGVPLPYARVMLVGMGRMGKSWLLRKCFRKDPPLPTEPPSITDNIDFFQTQDCTVDLRKYMDARPSDLKTTLWDFGGQAVKHGVHEGFFTDTDQRTVFLLVVSARRVPGNGTGETDETTGNRIVYWLRTLAHFVGSKSPVVIAITQCDDLKLPKEIAASDWKQGKRPIDELIQWSKDTPPMTLVETPKELLRDIFEVNVTAIVDGLSALDPKAFQQPAKAAKYDVAIEKVRMAIARAIETDTVVLKARVPKKYEKFADDVTKFIATRTWCQLDQFREWCKTEGGMPEKGDQDFLMPLLYAHGRLFQFGHPSVPDADVNSLPPGQRHRKTLADEYRYNDREINLGTTISHPGWLKDCVYRIVDHSTDGERQGWFSRTEHLEPLIRYSTEKLNLARQLPGDHDLILEFLEITELCWKRDSKRGYLFPRGLDFALMRDRKRWNAWPVKPLPWDFLPEANFFRLMVALHKHPLNLVVIEQNGEGGTKEYQHGRNWIQIRDPKGSGTQAVVLAFPDDGLMEIRFDPSQPQTLEGQQWIVQTVHNLMWEFQGKPANIPEGQLKLVNEQPLVQVSETLPAGDDDQDDTLEAAIQGWADEIVNEAEVTDPEVVKALKRFYPIGLCVKKGLKHQKEIALALRWNETKVFRALDVFRKDEIREKLHLQVGDQLLQKNGNVIESVTPQGESLMDLLKGTFPGVCSRIEKEEIPKIDAFLRESGHQD